MGSPSSTDAEVDIRMRQQQALAELGQQALAELGQQALAELGQQTSAEHGQQTSAERGQQTQETDAFDQLVSEASDAVADALDGADCHVFQLLPGADEAVRRTNVGREAEKEEEKEERVDAARASTDGDTLVGRTIQAEGTAVVDDLRSEDEAGSESARLDESGSERPLFDEEVAGGIGALVGSAEDPWGVLIVTTAEPRSFTDHDVEFVEGVADVLHSVGEHDRARRERERALQRTERRFDAIFEDPNILVGLLEPDGTVLDINQTAMEYIDAGLADVTGELFWETPWWGEGDDVGSDVRAWTERAAAGEYVDFETDLTRPDGERYTLSGYFRPVTNEDGDVVSILVSDRDVTERKQRERELAESERRYRSLAEYFPNGLVTLFDRDLEYTLAAGQGFDSIPLEADDLEGHTVFEAWDEDTATALEPVFEAALDGVEQSVELAYAGREWIVHAVPITDEDGAVVAGMTMAQDVTERTERERELAKYETIVETMNDGIYVKDGDGRFTMVNDAYAELTGYDREELVGEHASLVVDEDAIQESRAVLGDGSDGDASDDPESTGQATESGGADSADEADATAEADAIAEEPPRDETVEAVLQRNDGEAVPTEGTFSTLQTDDGEAKEVGVVRDISDRKEQRRKIEESERRYRTLVEHFPNGAVGLFDENLEYTALGGQFLESAGIEKEERIGSNVSEIYPEEILEEVEPYFEAALEGELNAFEVEYHDRHLFAHTLPVTDADDDVFAGMLVVQDVTERREAQRELRESEAKFRMLAENLEEIVWMATEDADEFVYINPAFEDVWGLDREDLYDESLAFLDAVHPDDRERVRSGFTTLPEQEFDEEFRIVRPDGEIRWVHARGARVYDEETETARVVGIGNDVTERRERERDLERAHDLLDRTEHIADVGGWEVDVETMDVYWTDHVFELLEQSSDEEPSLEAALDMYVEDDRPTVAAAIENAIDAGEPFDVEARIRTRGGDVRWLRLQGVPEIDGGEVVSLRGAAQDITDQIESEQRLEELIEKLEESNERLEQFAYAASHDLQEPLRMVSSYLQLLERRYVDDLDEDAREFIDFAVDGAERMRGMIEGLLEYSRVDTRGDPFEAVELDAVVADVRADLQMKIEESDAEITAESLPRVDGDGGQLRQVFQNLFENAIEYSGDEPPRIHVSAQRSTPAADEQWEIAVRDEGIGIDPEDADRIFEVFQSLHSTGEHQGTGIGLALAERIVERHGGEIWVDSEPGDGTTISFTLPAASEAGRDEADSGDEVGGGDEADSGDEADGGGEADSGDEADDGDE